MIDVRLIGRGAEKQALREMLDSVREGRSFALVLRGEPGVAAKVRVGPGRPSNVSIHVAKPAAWAWTKPIDPAYLVMRSARRN